MKHILLLIVSSITFLNAQDARQAGLLKALQHSAGKEHLSLLFDYARWWEDHNMDSSAALYMRAGELAEKLNDYNGKIRYYSNITYVLNQKGLADSGLHLNMKALALATAAHMDHDRADILFNIGSSYNNLGRYQESLEYYYKAATLLESLQDTKSLAIAYDNIGGVFTNSGQYENALDYHRKAVNAARSIGDTLQLTKSLINQSIAEIQLSALNDARQHLRDGFELSTRLQNTFLTSIALSTRSELFTRLTEYRAAISDARKASFLADSIHSAYATMEAMRALGKAYQEAHHVDSAIVSLQRAIDFADKNDFKTGLAELHARLALSYADNKDYRNAFSEQMAAKKILDAQSLAETQSHMKDFENRFLFNRVEQQLSVLQADKREKRLLTLALLLITLIVALGAILSVILVRRKRERESAERQLEVQRLQNQQQLLTANALLQGQMNERMRIARDLHDGLGGMLSGIKLQIKDSGSSQMLDHAIQEVRHIAHNIMPDNLMRFGLVAAVSDMVSRMNNGRELITLQVVGDFPSIENDFQLALYRCLQELITNAVRHSQATAILLQLSYSAPNISVTIEDNGIGISDTETLQNGFGWKSIRDRVAHFNGEWDIKSAKGSGTSVHLHFNIKSN